jgi:hypothetical protein
MSWTVTAELEDALWAAARARVPEAWLGGPGLTAAVIDRSRRYTSDRAQLSAAAGAWGDLAARALFFTVADAAKIQVPLAELAMRGLDPCAATGAPIRVLDLGAGCGAMSLGLIAHVAAHGGGPLAIELIDRDARALAIAADAIRGFASAVGVSARVDVRTADVSAVPAGPYALIAVGSVVNELAPAAGLGVVRAALRALAPTGALIVIEPALRETARALHAVRDAILGAGDGHVFAPCTRRTAPCPMLASEHDWCHEERTLELPPRAMRLAVNTGLRDGAMKFAYLTLRRAAADLGDDPGARRIVGFGHKPKGRYEVPACGADGLVTLRLLRRNRHEGNRTLEHARRGDLVSGFVGSEVTAETRVTRITLGEALT